MLASQRRSVSTPGFATPLNVDSKVPQNICVKQPDGTEVCTPGECPAEPAPGVVCYKASWRSVTVTQQGTGSGGSSLGTTWASAFTDMCGFLVADTSCPRVSWGGTTVYAGEGDLNEPYYFTYETESTIEEGITISKLSGQLPPGLTLSSDGFLSGIPTTPGLYTFTLVAEGDESRVKSLMLTNTVRICDAC